MAPASRNALAWRSPALILYLCNRMQRAAHVPPLAIVRGKKRWVFDGTGRRYVAIGNSRRVNLFGHADARLGAALGHCFTSDAVGQQAR